MRREFQPAVQRVKVSFRKPRALLASRARPNWARLIIAA
jgi:hypothetical protein